MEEKKPFILRSGTIRRKVYVVEFVVFVLSWQRHSLCLIRMKRNGIKCETFRFFGANSNDNSHLQVTGASLFFHIAAYQKAYDALYSGGK